MKKQEILPPGGVACAGCAAQKTARHSLGGIRQQSEVKTVNDF